VLGVLEQFLAHRLTRDRENWECSFGDFSVQANTALETELAEIDAGTKRNEVDIANYLQEIARQRGKLPNRCAAL
jgi:hypothetical protein